MSSGDALSSADGTQPPDAGGELDAEPAPEAPLTGLDLPRLPSLPPLPDLHRLTDLRDVADEHVPDYVADRVPDDDVADDDVPTPPQWPAVSPADPPVAAVPPAGADPPAAVSTPATQGTPGQPPTRPARPTVRDAEPSLLGLTRRSRTRVGQLAFTWIFAAIFAVILVQLIIALLTGR